MDKLPIFAISDSSGETAMQVAKTAGSQFNETNLDYERYPFITTESILNGILKIAAEKQAVIFHTLVNPKLSDIIENFAEENDLQSVDCIQSPMKAISNRLGSKPERVSGMVHDLNEEYFKRIAAMEFSVENDDGNNPQNLKEADVVILGISRTSKTPLSLYLANKKLKVSNVPIGPETQLPEEIWKINNEKIFGLTSDISKIQKIRQARMLSYGLEEDTPYSNSENIKKELDYAKELYNKLNCLQINVADKSIEETATIIMESLNIDTK
ncbi:pyruvate, water dikinase regulatory protein [Apilactobacillus timberlakei]|uniref:Putative pyruvate, phosphate dikinase regulatory protein n=1 Tax=Apilactobacillus timberlakei TaxID=2008380 RepID=A0ABY2YT87_9LACO|nr:pyruvate, water dikinase regulatory protein [Apilactobacillus timberlakei]TPR13861.1 kinase/pyrophosphorylase [Apilactobacillus timberlakei]TPR15177.1 kinase/pyrophosphorylase [Apilactobacillus timberlakei]TPR17068.1 kinase/pyrophosphorylase [Apilactobacillus timberlakei]TPR17470.1 kinase/pyrophosphorylase [Apilactobacillus timberlakei]